MNTLTTTNKIAGVAMLLLMIIASAIPGKADDAVKYRLMRAVNPANFGYTPPTDQEYAPGTRLYLNADSIYISNNYGFRFVKWTIDTETVSTLSSFEYTMPARDVTLTAHYVFDPTSPSHPGEPIVGAWLNVAADPIGTSSFAYSHNRVSPGREVSIW